jgi:SAM-dependent methyltransferase
MVMDDYSELRQRFPEINDEMISWESSPVGATAAVSRQHHWRQYTERNGLQPVEFLLPRLPCDCPAEEPGFILERAEGCGTYSREQVVNKVEQLQPWGFYFRLLDDITTEPPDEWPPPNTQARVTRNRTVCRSHLITTSVARLLGDRLSQTRVLDLGANSGFFSFDIAHRGAQHVTAVEMRDDNLARGEFLKQHYGFNNIDFVKADVMHWQPEQPVEVVFNLGLLYHVLDPVGLLQRTYDWCTDFAVVDTVCHRDPVSAFLPRFNKDPHQPGEGRYEIELHPTYRALVDTMHHVGFRNLVELVAVSGRVSGLYRDSVRRCIIGFK